MMTIADKGYWKSRVGSLQANSIPVPPIPIIPIPTIPPIPPTITIPLWSRRGRRGGWFPSGKPNNLSSPAFEPVQPVLFYY